MNKQKIHHYMKWLPGVCVLAGVLIMTPGCRAIDYDELSASQILRVEHILSRLEPVIAAKNAEATLATLTYKELYAPLITEDQEFLSKFDALDATSIGVTIPFRGIATGEEELVVIRDQRITLNGVETVLPPQFLPPAVLRAYADMMDAMEQDIGRRLYIESGYRSSAYQLYLFLFYLKNHAYSIRETARFVALPGYSEHGSVAHQAIDFINADGMSGETNPSEFDTLPEYAWLEQNAHRFHFVLSYPKHSPGITYEPWHWRYET
jgi:hypothetical protein